MQRFLLFVLSVVWIGLVISCSFPDPQGTDFFPLWLGAGELLSWSSPYSAEVSQKLVQEWHVLARNIQGARAIAYPIPVLMIMVPFALVPLQGAVYLWFMSLLGSGVVMSSFAVLKKGHYILPLLYFPIFHCLLIKNSSLLWAALGALLYWSCKQDRKLLAVMCLALLPAKPQAGLILALWGFFWCFRNNRKIFVYGCLSTLLFWGGSVVLFPDWPFEWWGALSHYRHVATVWLMPWALVLLLCTYKLPTFAIAAVLQVILFPVNDIYRALPLLFVWFELPIMLSVPGLTLSWLAPLFYDHPNNVEALWLTIILPLTLASLFATKAWRFLKT